MKNHELDSLLHAARAPQRDAEYWREFPQQVIRQIRRPTGTAAERKSVAGWKIGWLVAGLTAAVAMAFYAGFSRGQSARIDQGQLANVEQYFRQVEAMFPNQLQAIVFAKEGPRLILAEKPDVPRSTPVFLKVCSANGCEGVLTFSGQQIEVNGRSCEVLLDSRENILLISEDGVWSSAERKQNQQYRIQGKALENL